MEYICGREENKEGARAGQRSVQGEQAVRSNRGATKPAMLLREGCRLLASGAPRKGPGSEARRLDRPRVPGEPVPVPLARSHSALTTSHLSNLKACAPRLPQLVFHLRLQFTRKKRSHGWKPEPVSPSRVPLPNAVPPGLASGTRISASHVENTKRMSSPRTHSTANASHGATFALLPSPPDSSTENCNLTRGRDLHVASNSMQALYLHRSRPHAPSRSWHDVAPKLKP
ncbi:hypothetical protein KC19_3G170900 [Ceratodon purpureus]|uniref:Uncharacterized protein n=1 Tax=Ceratodon purpureus TaxID=3225 RepID=A0A8T0IJH4_CERPU|nr:hypothetical protein KC19_3G170900 [Ceratodon purpureus]